MEARIDGAPSFSHVHIDLAPGETIIAESDAMATMAADLDLDARLNGGLIGGIARKYLGGESLFINHISNRTAKTRRVTLVQSTPGDIRRLDLSGNAYCLQKGAYLCSTPDVKLNVKWAGFGSFIGGEGLFKLVVSGTGSVWYGAYGGLIDKEIDGEYIVDSSHLVGYEPHMKLKAQFSGGPISSLTSGEGLVTRVEGKGTIVMQSRSIKGLAAWVNPRL